MLKEDFLRALNEVVPQHSDHSDMHRMGVAKQQKIMHLTPGTQTDRASIAGAFSRHNDVAEFDGPPWGTVLHGLSQANSITAQDFTLPVAGFDFGRLHKRSFTASQAFFFVLRTARTLLNITAVEE